MQVMDAEMIQKIETLAPGFLDAAKEYYSRPEKFFEKLYEAHGELLELSRQVKELSAGYSHFRTTNQVSRSHVTWSSNWHEMRLSKALLEENIAHVRQHVFENRFIADFMFRGALVVEVDGSFHAEDAETKSRDKKKNKFFKSIGLGVLRFSTEQVEKELPWVMQKIKHALSQL